jgi:hypothetical protein
MLKIKGRQKLLVSILTMFVSAFMCHAQSQNLFSDSNIIQAKVWSKDENKQVHYSEWQSFSANKVSDVIGFNPSQKEKIIYASTKKNEFFHTEKINNRWYVINPNGQAIVITAVNGIKISKSDFVPEGFTGKIDWISKTIDTLRQLGFNTAGCWSDTGTIIQYNRIANNPFAYTTQLNLLAGFASDCKKKNPDLKSLSTLSFIFDKDFPAFCEDKCATIAYLKNDKNLLGHFSDNELPFTNSEMKSLFNDNNNSDKCFSALKDWMKSKGIDSLNDDAKKQFMGYVAGKYYAIVSAAIKKADPNHMNIGSRIHSNAKNNKYIFEAAEPFVDIISINYYGDWQPKKDYLNDWINWSAKPFFITEFYTKAEETGMSNKSGAGWIVKTHQDRGIHYQNFCMQLLQAKNCVGWHWFRYQDNDPNDAKADDSNKDSNKGLVNLNFQFYKELADKMKELNTHYYQLISLFDSKNK